MERSIKKTTGKLLAGFLAVLMVLSMFTTILCELDFSFLNASAAGDDTDVVHTNTAYSNTDYSVLTGNVALVGSGFGTDISADLKAALGTYAAVTKYATADAVLADAANVSLVVYACGTEECVEATTADGKLVTVADFESALIATVNSFKAAGIDVLLVTPGPITEYGENMYYAQHSDLWTPSSVSAGDNVSNRLSNMVDAINTVAEDCGVGVLSIYGKAKLSGEAEYMDGSADGIYPGAYGYSLMTRWIAEYVAEHYVLANETVKSGVELSGSETIIELDSVTTDIDAVVLDFAAGAEIPEKISVQTTKAEEDQWFEAVADVEIKKTTDGIYTASLVFSATTAKYIRISAENGTFANVTAGVYKTALVNPVVTYPVMGDNVSTKYAFNIEWSAVSGADRYDVVIADTNGDVLKKFTTSEDTQAIPAGLLVDGTQYNISVTSIRSGYIDPVAHSGNGSSGVFTASKTAAYKGNSETIDESVSSGKLVSIGAQSLLSTNASVTLSDNISSINTTAGSVLTDGVLASYSDEASTNVLLHRYGSESTTDIVIDLGSVVASVTGVFFDVGFFAANHSANAKPISVLVSYSTDGVDYSSGYEMVIGSGVRAIALAEDSEVRGSMTRYSETRGYSDVQYIKLSFTFNNVDDSDFYLDEIHVIGTKESVGVISRDGATILNQSLVGANRFDGEYTSGTWITDPNFAAVAALGTSVPVELYINLNADMTNNAISHGNHVITALDLAYAVDVDAMRPSSIVVSVQKEGETTWIEVGGKVYVTHGLASASDAEYVLESIPLTMADGSNVEAAYVKITLYSNINNATIPASYTSTGNWGTWFALSHLNIKGGQYIGSIEADGATAAYHANYLQNTALVGRDTFGDVNNTDIWNTISWKTAAYTTSDSGYLVSTGNITVGKIYWASQAASSSSTNAVVGETPSAINPNSGNVEVKAEGQITISSISLDSSTTSTAHSSSAAVTVLTDGDVGSGQAWNASAFSRTGTGKNSVFVLALSEVVKVTKVIVYGISDNGGSALSASAITVEVSSDGTTWTAASATISATGTPTTAGNYCGDATLTLATATTASYVRVSVTQAGYLLSLEEIRVYGDNSGDFTAPVVSDIVISEVTTAGYRVTATVTDNVGVSYVYFPTWTAADGQDDIVWHTATISGNTATAYISVADHNNESGVYYTHIYAYDAANNQSECGIAPTVDVPSPGSIANLAPSGTYAYVNMLPGDGMNYTEGTKGIIMAEDYEVPDYDAGYSVTTIAGGGTGHRDTEGVYAVGKLNDGLFGIYSNGVTPYRWVGWHQDLTNEPDGMTIVFDIGAVYQLQDVYFYNVRKGNAARAGELDVNYYFSADGSSWSSAVAGTWSEDGTVPQSSSVTTAHTRYKNTAYPSGAYRYVKIVIDNNTGDNTNTHFYLDEVVINGDLGVSEGPDTTEKNWALDENGGQYKGTGTLQASVSDDLDTATWSTYHSGKINDGDNIRDVRAESVGILGSNAVTRVTFKLASKVDVNTVNVYVGPYQSKYFSSVTVYVADSDASDAELTTLGTANSGTTHSGDTQVYTVTGNATGRYVIVETVNEGYLGFLTEIEIFGVKSAQLDNPVITSHYDEQEIGMSTTLDWEDVTADEDGVIVTYDVTVTDAANNVVSVATGLTTSQVNFDSAPFTMGEGYYTITVTANANGWYSGITNLVVYYAPKYIITFKAADGALLKSSGQTSQSVQFGIYEGSAWNSDEVLGAVANVTALPYTGADGQVYYFSHWIDSDGNEGVPSTGEVSANYTFTAQYTLTDTTGVLDDTKMTDGIIYDGRGSVSDYYFTFENNQQNYDYVIIDLGDIYYSLTEFDVSFYKMGDVLPFQITFEVSSKVYVPTISQGAAFDDSDWLYVSVVQSDSYVYDASTGRYSFSDDVKYAPIIDGAFGRYVKVTFYYDTSCTGVYVDEIMVSGSDEYDRTNIAEEKEATVNGVYSAVLTDGIEGETASGTEFIVELDDIKTGITSFQLVGADNTSATFYISAGGDNFYEVETLVGENGSYELSDKVSARRVKITLAEEKAISEIRVYGDPGLENFYLDTDTTAEIVLKSGTVSLDNVVSLKAVDVELYGETTAGTATYGAGAAGSGTGFAMTDGFDIGYANGVSFVTTSKGRLWYGMYSSKKGINNYINATFVTQWTPTLDSTSVDFTIGTQTYKFEFNGDVEKGFIILQSDSAVPYSYSASRSENEWIVEFTVSYADVNTNSEYPNVPADLSYSVTAYEGGTSVGTTGTMTYEVDGVTTGWDYSASASTWTTLNSYDGNAIAWMELDRVYYGLNTFAISVLDASNRGYAAPESIRFQVSTDNINWTDVGYTAKEAVGDYRYYDQYQPTEAYIYNFSVNFEGISAKYVRAVMAMADTSKSVAVQEFWVNALPESLKEAGGDNATNSFDYKMLWDDEYLYIAIQYEEDEIPFYTASHDYYETFAMNYDTSKWNQTGTAGEGTTNAFVKSSLFYDVSTGFFQLNHDITRLGDENTNANGYSNIDFNNFKLYKVSSVEWNKGYDISKAHFMYGSASLTNTIETSVTVFGTNESGKQTLDQSSTMNGYILVSDGYALSQEIDGKSLSAVPITIDGDTIPADQITNDLVWFFEDSDWTDMTDYSKSVGDYLIYGFRYGTNDSSHYDRVYFDEISSMIYSKFYLTRAYQGLLWENVYTFTRFSGNANTYFNFSEQVTTAATLTYDTYMLDSRNNHSACDINWNVKYDEASGMWSVYVHGQGTESYSHYLDNIDGRSSFRLYMSVANLNDTARYDYGNFDFVLDTYILDNATVTLTDGTVIPVTEDMDALYQSTQNMTDVQTAWDGYKNVEFKSTALGMTGETNNYQLDVSTLEGRAKMSQSENGQNLITVEIAIPFTQLGFVIEKTGTTVDKWGNFYTKMGVEKPLGKRTLMQFDSKYGYTADNAQTDTDMTDIDEFYYYVDASEFGYILQMAPEGKGYQDLSYTDGEGYSTISSVRGEVLNTTNGEEIEYTPTTFDISTIHSTNADPKNASIVSALNSREAFTYVEEDGIYYFTSQLDHGRVINQGGNISTEIMIPAGGAYFSFDWKVQSETSDTLSVWVETTERWNEEYADWIDTYNCGIPYKYYSGATSGSQKTWLGVLDYSDESLYTLYSEVMATGATSWKVNGVELKNDPCVAFISGYQDNPRNPENLILASWKENKRSEGTDAYPVNIDDVIVYSPIVDGDGSADNGMYRHVWDWNNITMWIPNTTGEAISYTITWMYWKNGSEKESYNASDGRGTDDCQIANFHLSTTDELGYWKTSENWDTLRLDATVADPTDTMLGVKDLASAVVQEGEQVPAINASTNDPDNLSANTFGESEFLTLSYAAIAETEEVGTTTTTTSYFQTKNRINISASNVPAAEISKYINNAIVFTQEYSDHLSNAGALLDWTILELVYNTSYNTWVLNRLFEEGVDKSKFNIYADNNTIIIALNYTYSVADLDDYGLSRDAVLFGYANREVLEMMTPVIRYKPGDGKIDEVLAADDAGLTVTQFITSNIFIRENYNVALGKMYSLRNYPTFWDDTYMYTENWFRENNTEDALAAFLAVYSETPLYYVNENGEIEGKANTDGDYREAFKYYYSSEKVLRFDTNQYGNVLYVPAGVGQLTDGTKMSVYSNTYLVEALEDYAIGYFVIDGMGTPSADTIEDIDPTDTVYSYIQDVDTKHDQYEVAEDIRTREENVIIDLGSVEYGLSAFKLRFLGGGEDGVVFPTSVEFAISTDGLSYSYIGSVALDDTGFNSAIFEDGYASIIYTGTTDTIYGNTAADYTFDLQTEGVTARYIKATIMNHSAQNEKTFISEFQVIQNAIYPDILPNTNASTWVDVSEDAILMYQDTLERWDNIFEKEYSFALAPTQAGYLFAEDEGYPDDGRANTNTDTFLTGQLTDGIGGTALYQYNYADGGTPPTLNDDGGLKDMSVGWMKAYAAEVSLTFDMGEMNDVGYVSVYALESKDGVDKITMPYNVTAYVSDDNSTWRKVATVNAKDNDSSEVALKGLDTVLETDEYIVYRYNLAFARDGELGLQLNNYRYVKVVAETDGGEDGWICLTEVEVFEGHPCYPVIDLTDEQYKKTAIGLTTEEIEEQDSEVRPTFFRGYYDDDYYYEEHYNNYYNAILDYYYGITYPDQTAPETYTEDVVNALSEANSIDLLTGYDKTVVYNNDPTELYTTRYVFGNVEQRALDGRGVPYFYNGDQLLLRVTTDQLSATEYNYQGDWVSTYKLLADSKIYYSDCKDDGTVTTTRVFTTTAVPTPMTICNVLARDEYTCEVPVDYIGEDSYYYLPIYLMNSLDYLKAVGYNVDKEGQPANYITMPSNKVELTGTVEWDTNYESNYDEYADDKNGVSLNIAPLGAKTNLGTVTYNDVERAAETTLRFGSIWYIDDAAYYNTHTHRQQYGTLIMTLNNLSRFLTDTYPVRAKYTSVYEDYGLRLTKISEVSEVTGVEEIKDITEVIKLSNVTEVIKLTNVVETDAANAKFTMVVDGATVYYTCDQSITMDVENGIGSVWTSGDNYFYCANSKISNYKYTTVEGDVTRYWYCKEGITAVNWVDDNGHWYSADSSIVSADNVYSVVLNNGKTVYYYCAAGEQAGIKIMSRDTSGTAHYWTCNESYPSWTYTTIDGNTTRYWYSADFDGIAGGVVIKDGEYYVTSSTTVYNDVLTTLDGEDSNGNRETRYWSARTAEGFAMLSDLQSIIDVPADYSFDEEQIMAGLDRFLEYINNYGNGKIGQNYDYVDFGGIVQHSRANRYYYYSNITTELVPNKYDGTANDPFAGVDSNPDEQNMTDLLGVYNYDQRYLEFDAIIAGIPSSQKDAKIVAIPYAIYANNYEFLEFGEHLGEGDAYVEETWGTIFEKYYGTGASSQNVRYFVYGGAVARSINGVLDSQTNKQYD